MSILIAVACALTVTTTTVAGPDKVVHETLTLVLDDAKQTVLEWGEQAASLTPVCRDCNWIYGAKSIRAYSRAEVSDDELFLWDLDRVSGSFRSSQTFPYGVTTIKSEGQCVKAAMPTVGAVAARKF